MLDKKSNIWGALHSDCIIMDNDYSINIENNNYELPTFNSKVQPLGELLNEEPISAILILLLIFETRAINVATIKTRGGQGGINGTKLKMLNIPIIKKVKQNEIIEKCDKIMNEVNYKIKRDKISNIIEEYLQN